MRFNSSKKFTSLLLGSMLIVAMAFTTSGCVTNNPADSSQLTTEVQATETQTTEAQTTVSDTAKVLGEGETMFVIANRNFHEINYYLPEEFRNKPELLQGGYTTDKVTIPAYGAAIIIS